MRQSSCGFGTRAFSFLFSLSLFLFLLNFSMGSKALCSPSAHVKSPSFHHLSCTSSLKSIGPLLYSSAIIQQMASVKVFGSPASAEVARVLTCLFEKEVEFQLIRVDSYKGLERKPDYLKLQPTGEALTFEDGKITLVDSRAACRHIAEKYAKQGNKDLLGTGTLERASIEQWLQTEAQSFDPPSSALAFHLAFAPVMGLEQDEVVIEESKKKLAQVLDIYEQRLKESQFLAGDKFTLADLSHLPNGHRLVAATRCRHLFKSREKVNEWWEKISRCQSWRKVVEMQQQPPPVL